MEKKYLLIIALIAVTVFGAGCSKEESSVIEDSSELNITTNIVESSTKSAVSSFDNSNIGVFVDDDDDTYSPTTSSTASVSTGNNSVTVTPSIYINADATVYAYYPASESELSSPTSTSTKDITVVNADDFSATSQTDYLWSTPVNVTKANRIADLTFKHALSKVIFKVKKVDDFTEDEVLSEISLKTTASDDTYKFLSGSGTMGISDGSISGLTVTDNLTYTGSSSITLSTTATEIVAIVAPATLAASTSATSTITITLTIDGSSYRATLPVSDVSAWVAGNTYTYNITVNNGELEIVTVSNTDWVSNTTTIDATIKIAAAPEVTETANCYMIAPDNRLKIPVNVRGNGVEVESTGISATISSPLSVGILWQTSPDLIFLSDMSTDEKVTITANSEAGNAVIAVYDGEDQTGNILWSWHIWVTDYDPDVPSNGTTYPLDNSAGGSYVFMDRNIGATTATPGNVSTLGLLYQWGRKDPFPGSASTSIKDGVEPTIYNASGTGSASMVFRTAVSVTSNLDNAIKNPLTYYYGTSANDYDWYSVTASTHNDAFWGGADINAPGDKTMFDPSPVGWRVPTFKGSASPWTKFTTSTFSWNATYLGRTYTDGSFYPAAGSRSYMAGSFVYVGNYGHYWSGSPYIGYGHYLYFGISELYPVRYSLRAQGFSVRCVKDK